MQLSELLAGLSYDRSANFLTGTMLQEDIDNAHIYRKAQEGVALRGVYALQGSQFHSWATTVPIVFVCEANDAEAANRIHRLVWNQNVVPFVVVNTPREVRLYSGFTYSRAEQSDASGLLRTAESLAGLGAALEGLDAHSIDDGVIWRTWGKSLASDTRVDRKLLSSLYELEKWLMTTGIDDRTLVHALIGKFVYLHYLRAREILSERKLNEWGLSWNQIAQREANLNAFQEVLTKLDDWLNGAVFPMKSADIAKIGQTRLRSVASVFSGDTLSGQLHLDFEAYDFSFIPIETLSVIYEQFLHAADSSMDTPRGVAQGAYYTPVSVVNLILDVLEQKQELKEGMRVLDPACGSGVFLVQCYRRLVERATRLNDGKRLRPVQLRELLTRHIFGFDIDREACQVAELSLILTLLDYIQPPDLTSNSRFQLPALVGTNLIHGNAFDEFGDEFRGFDWIVGNPPWKELSPHNLSPEDRKVFAWMRRHRAEMPTGNYQVAEAFAWRVSELSTKNTLVGLLIPAMSLFKSAAMNFRKRFLKRVNVWWTANFANLAYVLFGGRSEAPAAAVFYEPKAPGLPPSITVYSPLLANQVANRGENLSRPQEIWDFTVNASELREVSQADVSSGSALPWKVAMWGSPGDEKLLRRISSRFSTIGEYESDGALIISEGLQLRSKPARESEPLERHSELVDKPILRMEVLRRKGRFFTMPKSAIRFLSSEETYVRKGRATSPLKVSKPPHVIVSSNRTFAVFSNDFVIVPARQIGIIERNKNDAFLKALALYLNSDFVNFHQFFISPQMGIHRTIADLSDLRKLPVPFGPDSPATALQPWLKLYDRFQSLASFEERRLQGEADSSDKASIEWHSLVTRSNELANNVLGLSTLERVAIRDFTQVRFKLIKGKVPPSAIQQPSEEELSRYSQAFKSTVDNFIGANFGVSHAVNVHCGDTIGIVEIALTKSTAGISSNEVGTTPLVNRFGPLNQQLRKLPSQWVYFNRNLKVFADDRTYLAKPLEKLDWTETQAIWDATDFIAENVEVATS